MKRDGNRNDEFNEVLDTVRSLLGNDCDSADAAEANDLVNRALDLVPDDADAWMLKCQVMSQLNDDAAALAAVQMALVASPQSAEAHYWRTAVLSDLGRHDEALKSVERSFRYLQDADRWLLEDLYCEKAVILDAMGLEEEAVATYEEGLREVPSSSLLRSGLAPLRRAQMRATFQVLRGGLA